jgi:succinyl-CoA synthetase alpha subunit
MKFVELTPNICVNIDYIEHIVSTNEGQACTIYISGREYECSFSYRTLLKMLNNDTDTKLDNFLSVATVQTV